MAMKCIDQIVVPMIRPPFATEKLASHESLPASCDPDVRARAVSEPTIATAIESNTRAGSYVTTMLLACTLVELHGASSVRRIRSGTRTVNLKLVFRLGDAQLIQKSGRSKIESLDNG